MNKSIVVSLVALTGTVAFAASTFSLPQNGLLYHLDVMAPSTLTVNDDGQVTEWRSVEGDYSFGGDTDQDPLYPYYVADEFGGRGAIRFGYAKDGTTESCSYLLGNASKTHRTVILKYKWHKKSGVLYNQLWGNAASDNGIRCNGGKQYFPCDDNGVYILDGQTILANSYAWKPDVSHTLAFMPDESLISKFTCTPGVGSYWVNSHGRTGGRWSRSVIAEVIAYDRVLSDDEREQICAMLDLKWDSDCLWIGGGETTDWNDAGNWLNGKVPAKTDTVYVRDATVSVSEDVLTGFIDAENVTFEIAAGKTFVYGSLCSKLGGGFSFVGEGKAEQWGTDLPVTEGLVFHLDASSGSSLVTNGNGQVTKWMSRAAGGYDFVCEPNETTTSGTVTYPSLPPLYVAADGPMGRPALKFGATPDGAKTTSYLKGLSKIKHRTLFFLCRPPHNFLQNGDKLKTSNRHDNYCSLYAQYQSYLMTTDMAYKNNSDYDANHAQCWNAGYANAEGGQAFVDGQLRFDYDRGDDNAVPFSSDMGDDFHLLTLVYGSGKTDANVTVQPMVGGGYVQYGRHYNGTISEIAVYDRILSDSERRAVENAILFRAFGVEWTGLGGDGKWSTAANWSTGAVPTRRNYVKIANAAVAVDGDAAMGVLEMDHASLSLAADKALQVFRLAGSAEGNALSLGDGSVFTFNVYAGDDRPMPAAVTGTGTLVKRGVGTLTLSPGAIASTVGLTVDDGAVDLNGTSPTVAALGGEGLVTNTSDTASVLTVRNESEAVLSARVAANVKLAKDGAGTLVAGFPFPAGDLTIKGGVVNVVSNLAYAAYTTGVVAHLDAMRRDSIETDSTGRIIRWHSLVGDGLCYGEDLNKEDAYSSLPPKYHADLVRGKFPCAYFGFDDENTAKTSYLVANRTFRQQSYFFVMMPKVDEKAVGPYTSKSYIGSSAGVYGQQFAYSACPLSRWALGGTAWNLSSAEAGLHVNGLWKNDKVVSSGKDYYGAYYCGGGTDHTAAHPHVVYAQTSDDENKRSYNPVLGGYYLAYHQTSSGNWIDSGRRFTGAVCEVIVLDHYATDEEREAITAALMRKWEIVPEAEQAFPDEAEIASLTVDAQGGATVPALSLLGDVDVSGMDLTLLNIGGIPRKGAFLSSTGTVTGPFKSVTGLGSDFRLDYNDGEIVLHKNNGIVIIVR